MTKLFAVVMLSLSGLLLAPAVAQTGGQDIPIPTWHAPAFWDGASATSDSTRGLQANVAASGTPVTGASALVGIVPCRLVDTRDNTLPAPFGIPSITGGTVRTVTVRTSTRCNIPATATAYSLNFTVVPLQATLGYLSAWPTPDRPVPEVSILNSPTGQIIANAAVIPAGTNGAFDLFVTHTADVIIDINGYYAPNINLAVGSAAAPTLTFGSDAGTGLYSSGAGTVSITTGGQNRLTVRADGDLELPGSIRKGGYLFLHNLGINSTATGVEALSVNTGYFNTANGTRALKANTTGSNNTANGSWTLLNNTTGNSNTANGYSALYSNTTGFNNSANGGESLYSNTTGNSNTAGGHSALFNNTTGSANTASGSGVLYRNTTGSSNTATGSGTLSNNTTGNNNTANGVLALLNNTTGSENTADGVSALNNNTTGIYNTANGSAALFFNTTGETNTASGGYSLFYNTTGFSNTANGFEALEANTTGNRNIAMGYRAGNVLSSGSDNIYIGNLGATSESDTIRIGRGDAATRVFLDGVWGRTTGISGAVPVVVDANGQLGTISSSRRYKEDIRDMAGSSTGLMELRPVTFRYKKASADGSKPVEYGLIAEEVAEVYPDLVVRGPDGQVETVQYQKLTPMLLNELKKQHALIRALEERLAALEACGDRTAER